MSLALGIDTGGTYTDAVLVEYTTGEVLAAAKALTTRHNLAIGIEEAIGRVLESGALTRAGLTPEDIRLVALSTTLATNSVVEGQGGVVCLLLLGYDPELMQQCGFERDLVVKDVVYLRGGHDYYGNEAAPLDEEAARAAILARRDRVEAFAVSGYFGVYNPVHELRVRAMVEELTGLPVTCGHELTSELNAVRRATTVALNAQLIVPLRELIATVRRTLDVKAIDAPLMVVKGDGSLVRAEWAMHRPIETILSGPAASVVGAWHLAGRRDVWVVDVGGTTTDIAALRGGWPSLNPEGAQVGGWRTMVEAVDVHTTGLGGDSHVQPGDDGRIVIGPRRVVPLCLLASEHPGIVAELHRQAATRPPRSSVGTAEFVMAWRSPGRRLSERDRDLLDQLATGPRLLAQLIREAPYAGLVRRHIAELEAQSLVRRAGFTPTDALHVLGRFTRWNVEAAQLGAELLAAQAGLTVETFCERVVRGVADRVATAVVTKVLEDEVGRPNWDQEPAARALLGRALDGGDGQDLECTLRLRRPLVAIGAPVGAYMPGVARRLHTELVIPPHAEVANAVGAVAGGVIQRVRVLVNPLEGDTWVRLHLPDGVHDFDGVEPAVAYAQEVMRPRVEAMARQAGAEHVEVHVARQDHRAPIRGSQGGQIYLGTELSFTAMGRPSPARR